MSALSNSERGSISGFVVVIDVRLFENLSHYTTGSTRNDKDNTYDKGLAVGIVQHSSPTRVTNTP